MKSIYEKHIGTLIIEEPYEIFGMVVGDIIVRAGGRLKLHGMCTKTLILEERSEASIHGMVNGDVLNDGGILSVHGMINGTLVEQRGKTTVSENAKIARRERRITTEERG